MTLLYRLRDPDKAYVTNNLLLPKHRVNVAAIQNALKFVVGEEDVIDSVTEELIGTRPKILYMWDETKNHIIVPRNFIDIDTYKEYPFEFVIEGYRGPYDAMYFYSRASPRNETQEEAISKFTYGGKEGVLNLACGKGKTVISLMIAAEHHMPVVVIVNSKSLIAQWREEIRAHLLDMRFGKKGSIPKIGLVQGKTIDWEDKPIVIATVQTLALKRDAWPMAFRKRFGLVIFDEAHHMSAPVFVKAADLFYGKRLALTATATRTDGLEAIYQYHLGGVLYKNLEQDLIPATFFHKLKWKIPEDDIPLTKDVNGEVNVGKIRTYLGRLGWRNDLIAENIQNDLNGGRTILVLSHSKDNVELLAGRFGKNNYITGAISEPEERHRILRECNPVFGTFQLARESLNKPTLDCLYIATVFGNSNDLQQSWGRTQRELKGKKEPIVRVYEDNVDPIYLSPEDTKKKNPLSTCVRSCRALRKFLKAMKYPYNNVTVNFIDRRNDDERRNGSDSSVRKRREVRWISNE